MHSDRSYAQTLPLSHSTKRTKQQLCTCNNQNPQEPANEPSRLELTLGTQWKISLEIVSMAHKPSCSFYSRLSQVSSARISIKSCGRLLSGAISAFVEVRRGAGGYSISPQLQCARVVPLDHPAWQLFDFDVDLFPLTANDFHSSIERRFRDLHQLMLSGQASPYDVDIEGQTLLHVRVS